MRLVAEKDTGNYDVALIEWDDAYFLEARWTGMWASTDIPPALLDAGVREDIEHKIEVDARTDSVQERDRIAVKWFDFHIRGDYDVQLLLSRNRYDDFGNYR